MTEPTLKTVTVPMLDTGLGIEAGYANDAELIAAAQAQRAELEKLLTPEALARLDAAEAELERRISYYTVANSTAYCSMADGSGNLAKGATAPCKPNRKPHET